jgi:hypothetical protein
MRAHGWIPSPKNDHRRIPIEVYEAAILAHHPAEGHWTKAAAVAALHMDPKNVGIAMENLRKRGLIPRPKDGFRCIDRDSLAHLCREPKAEQRRAIEARIAAAREARLRAVQPQEPTP